MKFQLKATNLPTVPEQIQLEARLHNNRKVFDFDNWMEILLGIRSDWKWVPRDFESEKFIQNSVENVCETTNAHTHTGKKSLFGIKLN